MYQPCPDASICLTSYILVFFRERNEILSEKRSISLMGFRVGFNKTSRANNLYHAYIYIYIYVCSTSMHTCLKGISLRRGGRRLAVKRNSSRPSPLTLESSGRKRERGVGSGSKTLCSFVSGYRERMQRHRKRGRPLKYSRPGKKGYVCSPCLETGLYRGGNLVSSISLERETSEDDVSVLFAERIDVIAYTNKEKKGESNLESRLEGARGKFTFPLPPRCVKFDKRVGGRFTR